MSARQRQHRQGNMRSAKELFIEAERLEDSGDEISALRVWRELSRDYPHPNSLCRLALLAGELGETDEAEGALRYAIKLDSSVIGAHLALGSFAVDRADYEEAEHLLRQSLRVEKTRAAYCLLGVSLSRLGRKEEAEASYRDALAVDPDFEEAYYNLGVLFRDSDPAEAEELFSKALALDPNYAEAHREFGWLLRKQRRIEESESHLRRAIQLQPDDAWAHIYLGNLLWRKGDEGQASTELEWARESAPGWAAPLWTLANLHEDRKEWAKAQDLYERALDLVPDDAVANMNFGRMLIKKGEPQNAVVFLRRALLLNPHDVEAKGLLDRIESP
jgi:tetratricopeptide (TPR) repeat protein